MLLSSFLRVFVVVFLGMGMNFVHAMDNNNDAEDQRYLQQQGSNVPVRRELIRRHVHVSPVTIAFANLDRDDQKEIIAQYNEIAGRLKALYVYLARYDECENNEYISILREGTEETIAELTRESTFLFKFMGSKTAVVKGSEAAAYIQKIVGHSIIFKGPRT